MTLLLVTQQVILLFRRSSTVGAEFARRRQRWPGFTEHRFQCQHPIFVFHFDLKLENLNSKNLFDFSGLPQFAAPVGVSLCSGERGSKGDPPRCQQSQTTKTTNPSLWFHPACGNLRQDARPPRALGQKCTIGVVPPIFAEVRPEPSLHCASRDRTAPDRAAQSP